MAIKDEAPKLRIVVREHDDLSFLLFKISEAAVFEPAFRSLRDQLDTAMQARIACRGFNLAQLREMNREHPGNLAKAYDVCSELDETFGEALEDDEEINGGDCVDVIAQLSEQIRAVTKWAR